MRVNPSGKPGSSEAARTILVINAVSSSVKFTLFGISDQEMVPNGLVERIGLSETLQVLNDTPSTPAHW